jgi:7,8-dihydropterin-6-yl-methyl-4-(beta-D-ribofuranosyl)aminobenzene 5'-phosphate synthase
MRISILCDNETESAAYLTEHGYSCWIETVNKKGEPVNILFDTGQTDLFLTNAARMNINVKAAHYVLISHGHYDHGGGIKPLLKEAPHSQIYLAKEAFLPHVKGDEGEKYYYCQKNIGLSPTLNEKYPSTFKFINEETDLDENITILPAAPLVYPTPPNEALCEIVKGGILKKDNFEHEIYLAIQEEDELYLFTGCAHRGIANIAAMVKERYPHMKSYTLIGGFHIRKDPSNEQINLLHDITGKESDLWRFISGHCSGKDKVEQLKNEVESPVTYGYTGKVISF